MKRDEAVELARNGFEQLSQALAEGRSESLQSYLSVMARFHRYSPQNCLLIAIQRPTATYVAGFHKWKQLGRRVKKGEKGIAIFAPMVYKRKAEEDTGNRTSEEPAEQTVQHLVGFKVVHVFDVEQTEGDPLPEFERVTGDPGHWLARLEQVVRGSGIELSYEECRGGAEGFSRGGSIVVRSGLPDAEKFFVLVHEYAHELLHQGERRKETSKTVRETEAEAVGFVVSQAIGLDACSHARDYIHLYRGDAETLQESMHFIQRTAARIIDELRDGGDADASDSVPSQPAEVSHVAR